MKKGSAASGSSFAAAMLSLELAHVLVTAVSSGLLGRLCAAGGTAIELADALNLSAEPTAAMLRALTEAGFAEERDGSYRASAGLSDLEARSPGGIAGVGWLWGHLDEFVRSGEPLVRSDGGDREREGVYADVVAKLARLFEPSAAILGAILAKHQPERILDVGAGSGVWSLAIAQQTPRAHVTALDLPKVVPRFLERAAALGLAERVTTLPRSYAHSPLSTDRYDAVILSSILHLESADDAEALVKRASEVLTEDGRLVVVDQLGGEGDAELARCLYALQLSMRTRGGQPHARGAIEAWLREAGLQQVALEPLDLPGLGALIASRRDDG